MLLFENCRIALQELWANKFRSTLTTLGIIIAVTSIIAVVAIIQGASVYMTELIQGLGPNFLWIHSQRPPGDEGKRMGRIELTYAEAMAMPANCPAIQEVSPVGGGGGTIQFRGTEHSAQVLGTTPAFQTVRNWYADEGRFFNRLELETRKDVVIMGRETVRKLDTTPENLLGDSVWINGRRFQVVGFLEEKGPLFGETQDDLVVIPLTTAAKIYGPWMLKRVFVIAQAREAHLIPEAVVQVRSYLRRQHGLRAGAPDDFEILTQDQFLEFFDKFAFIFSAILGGIVSVSLVVGGIGIMNIMLVSVTERTKEIGIRKAVGARGSDILWQFLIEAVTLSLLGGLIGIAGGYLIAKGGALAISTFIPIPPRVFIPLWAIAVSVTFAGGVGVVSGFYPAYKASLLDPIDALRHE